MLRKIIPGFFALLFLMSSCDTDFDITSDWQEIMVVYGLLDQTQSTHYIRVNKAFLSEGNALIDAQNPDSINYGEQLSVYFTTSNKPDNKLFLTKVNGTDNGIPKDTGDFANVPNILYRFDGNLNENYTYNLFVENTQTGVIATSSANIVKDFTIEIPNPSVPVNFASTSQVPVRIQSAENGKIYQMVIRFHYLEWNINNPGNKIAKFIDWKVFSSLTSEDILGTQTLNFRFPGEQFYSFLKNNLAVNDDIVRQVDTSLNLTYTFTVGGQELYDYISVGQAQSGITSLQANTTYSNIENGLGLFSSRYSKSVFDIPISGAAIDELSCGDITRELNFLDANFSDICN